MKPSERIYQLIGETRSDPEWQERCLEAVIEYLDEQWEKEQKDESTKQSSSLLWRSITGYTASQLRLTEGVGMSRTIKTKGVDMKPVLITTEFRGVFFGYVKDKKNLPEEITLTNARNCIYWSSDCKGFLGLAATGPTNNCKIGAKITEITLYKITSVTPVEDKAVEAWEKA